MVINELHGFLFFGIGDLRNEDGLKDERNLNGEDDPKIKAVFKKGEHWKEQYDMKNDRNGGIWQSGISKSLYM